MTRLRYGFKAEAERLSLELRSELGLGADDPVDPRDLAKLYGIPIVGASDLEVSAEHAQYFAGARSGSWSATTVFHGTRRIIVLNDLHDPRRLANSLSHELAHVFLEHEPTPVVNRDGSRTWKAQVEAEANEVGAQVLIPNGTARTLALRGRQPSEVADHFGVSEQLAQWRLNVSGGYKIRNRARTAQ
ncbi:MAG: ImmA/IrrE family metallo-endopeptidase [Dehalococcoidia bacterium]